MSPVVVDPVRLAPPGPSLVVAGPPKPAEPFGKVLARHVEPPKPETAKKPEEPNQPDDTADAAGRAERQDKGDRKGPAKVGAKAEAKAAPAKKPDAAEAEQAGSGEDPDATSENATAEGAVGAVSASNVTKPTNPVDGRAKTPADDGDDPDAAATPEPADTDATRVAALPVSTPTDGDGKPREEKPAADAKKPAADKAADAVDPTLVAGQAAAVTPAATPTGAPAQDKAAASAVADVTASPKSGKAPAAAGSAEAAAPADAENDVAVRPKKVVATEDVDDAEVIDPEAAAALPTLPEDAGKTEPGAGLDVSTLALAPHDKAPVHAALPPVAAATATPAKTVAEANVDHIVTSVRGELLTKGGTMDIRLDPPTLGTIHVSITVDNGLLSASIQTTSDEATRLLSHNLTQLKTTLESAGVSVEHIQVKQAAPTTSSNSAGNGQSDADARHRPDAGHDGSDHREQQRREMLQRMWAKLAGEPLDLVA